MMMSSCDPRFFLLFSLLYGIKGDCGPPPKLKNAVLRNGTLTESFRPFESVIYRCLDGFYNFGGKIDVTTCLGDSKWSPIEEFCDPSCQPPERYKFAEVKAVENKHKYPIGTTVTYICRPGYTSISGISQLVTCLENRTWTALPEFCEKSATGSTIQPGSEITEDIVKKRPGIRNLAAIIVGLSLGALILATAILFILFFLIQNIR